MRNAQFLLLSIPILLTVFCVRAGADVKDRSPLLFVENGGQITDQHRQHRSDIDFTLSGSGFQVFIGNGRLHYQWTKPVATGTQPGTFSPVKGQDAAAAAEAVSELPRWETYRLDVRLIGANPAARLETADRSAYVEHYYNTAVPGGIHAGAWGKVTYKEVYPGIDWVIYSRDGKLEYDFVVREGGRVSDIRIQYSGASELVMNNDGSITAYTPMGTITERAPVSFQADGKPVVSRFVLRDPGIVSFTTETYEGALTIDPVVDWATYYGGPGVEGLSFAGSFGNISLTTDAQQFIYLGGTTHSASNIATSGGHYQVLSGDCDAFLVKFNPAGVPVWATYYGGTDTDFGQGITCFTDGSVYLTGSTMSTDMISFGGAQQPASAGGRDAFLVKFDAGGNRIWATYFGGSGNDFGMQVTCDPSGNVYMAGNTVSKDGIATAGCHQDTFGGGVAGGRPPTQPADGFLTKYNAAGRQQWSTYYGGDRADNVKSIACDRQGRVFVTGLTQSGFNIASPGSAQDTISHNGVSNSWNMFLVRFDSAGNRIWGTYLGGNGGYDDGSGVSCDPAGNIYVAGHSNSSNLATPGAYKGTNGTIDAILSKFDPAGNRIWTTYYGGQEEDYYTGIACDLFGNVYAAGYTRSPSGVAPQGSTPQDAPGGKWDVFMTHFDTAGAFIEASYYGDTADDYEARIACDARGKVYLAGITRSPAHMATAGSHQEQLGGTDEQPDLFLVKFQPCTVIPAGRISGSDTICAGIPYSYYVDAVDGAVSYTWTLPPGWTGTSTGDTIVIEAGKESGRITVVVNGSCRSSAPQTKEIYVSELEVTIGPRGDTLVAAGTWGSYRWYRNDTLLDGFTSPVLPVTANGDYHVEVTDRFGCTGTSDKYKINNVGIGISGNEDKHILIYPNPARDVVRISSSLELQVCVRTIEGKLILSERNKKEVDVSALPAGTYFLELRNASDQSLIHTEQLTKY